MLRRGQLLAACVALPFGVWQALSAVVPQAWKDRRRRLQRLEVAQRQPQCAPPAGQAAVQGSWTCEFGAAREKARAQFLESVQNMAGLE